MNLKPALRALAIGTLVLSALSMSAHSAPGNSAPAKPTPSFRDFEKRAQRGDKLNVVFFGASLTWGANASDPLLFSYRADTARKFEAAYPKAHFKFWDGAIGGTGSQLGVFRLQRDVLSHHPDLVFLDFSANDDIYSDEPGRKGSYESLVRRMVLGAGIPVVQVIFPFKWNIKPGEMAKMKLRDTHLQISKAYNTGVGDAVALVTARVESGAAKMDVLWPLDGVHPGNKGYELFSEAAWNGYRTAVEKNAVCKAPAKMLFDDTYMANARVRFSSLGALPAGWSVGIPNRVSAFFDFLMSRWLDDETIASSMKDSIGADGKKTRVAQPVEKLAVKFRGTTVLLFGETTFKCGKYRVYIDGKLHEYLAGDKKTMLTEYDAGDFARRINGNGHYVQPIAEGLDSAVEHTLEIEPLFEAGKDQELRFESLLVAGGAATVIK